MVQDYLKILRSNAQEALGGRETLLAMHARAKEIGVRGRHPAAHLFNNISVGLTTSSLLALSRLHDKGKDAISIPRAGSVREISQPPEVKALKKVLNKDVAKSVAAWRTELYAHSLLPQISDPIEARFPIFNGELDEFIAISCQIVNAYSMHNRTSSAWPVVQGDPKTQVEATRLVDKLFA